MRGSNRCSNYGHSSRHPRHPQRPLHTRSRRSPEGPPRRRVVRLADADLDPNVASAPLLAVEVVSPSSRLVDLHLKRAVYAEMGIPSYWVVAPTQDWVVVSGLRGTGYEQVARAEGAAPLRVAEPFPVSFRPTDLLARFR